MPGVHISATNWTVMHKLNQSSAAEFDSTRWRYSSTKSLRSAVILVPALTICSLQSLIIPRHSQHELLHYYFISKILIAISQSPTYPYK